MMHLLKRVVRLTFIATLLVLITGSQSTLSALTAEQLRIYNMGIKTYVKDEIDCSATNTPTTPGGGSGPTGAAPKNIYMLGDSITNGAVGKYKAAFGDDIKSYINAAGGRSWNGGGIAGAVTPEGSLKPGKDAIVDDKAKIAAADGIVIALGTNGGESMNPIGEMIDAFRADGFNPEAPIWWVNTVSVAGLPALGDFNKKLDEEATSRNFKVINWVKAVNPAGDPYVMPTTDASKYMGDFVHPNGAGQDALVALVLDALKNGTGATAKTAGGTCQCSVAGGGGDPTLKGGTNPEIMFNYFVDKGLSAEQAAGITGNAMAESGENIDPAIVSPSLYRGIFQWDNANRWPRVVAYAQEKGKDPLLLETQMAFSWEEAEGRGNIEGIKKYDTVELAAWYWGRFYEVAIIGGSLSEEPMQNVQVLDKRVAFAKKVFDSFGGSATTSGGSSSGGCSSANVGGGDLAATVKAYAWPDARNTGDANARDMMPAYKEAVDKAKSEGRYTGGISYPGVDCGGFVTLALTDSGYEPEYNYSGKGGNTESQLRWVRENWERLGRGTEITTGELKLGDVAFKVTASGDNDGHTFMYVGEIDGFNGTVASAGLDTRAPSANGGFDHNHAVQSDYEWYRKK